MTVFVPAAAGAVSVAAAAPSGLTSLQGVGLFVGVPALTSFLIALPIYAPVWWRKLRHHHAPGAGDDRQPGPGTFDDPEHGPTAPVGARDAAAPAARRPPDPPMHSGTDTAGHTGGTAAPDHPATASEPSRRGRN